MQYRAPGRVNIIGEHTDYNEGYVLPTTTAAYTHVKAAVRDDRQVQLDSRNQDETRSFSLDELQVRSSPEWSDYARGVAAEIEATGIALRGADLRINGNIPIGGGLSSSASFEVAIAVALLDLANATLDQKTLARACQQAEIRYAGVNCGIMDQLAIAACKRDHAMFIDCRSLETMDCAIPKDARLLVIDSGVRHQLPESGYNDRAAECTEAAATIRQRDATVATLRDVSEDLLAASSSDLGDTLLRRARHIVTENQRVLDACDALQQGELERLGELVSASHASLRDDFEISCEQVDKLVEIADATDGTLGARQVGGGFGGCVLVVTTADAIDEVRARISQDYSVSLGDAPWTHVVSGADPAGRTQE